MSGKAWTTLSLFSRLSTQWNKGLGGLDGLNYDGLRAVAGIANITLDDDRLFFIQAMEQAVLSEVKKRE
jgi:hypothetical protein